MGNITTFIEIYMGIVVDYTRIYVVYKDFEVDIEFFGGDLISNSYIGQPFSPLIPNTKNQRDYDCES